MSDDELLDWDMRIVKHPPREVVGSRIVMTPERYRELQAEIERLRARVADLQARHEHALLCLTGTCCGQTAGGEHE